VGASRSWLRQAAVLLVLLSVNVALLPVAGLATEGVAPIIELGLGARSLAMGGAHVGLLDSTEAIFHNPAGLGWSSGLSVQSSLEQRIGGASFGSAALSTRSAGISVHYLDFGDIAVVDEEGQTGSNFSHRSYAAVVGLGISMGHLPFLDHLALANSVALGLRSKVYAVSTMAPGNGVGAAADFCFAFRRQFRSMTDHPLEISLGVLVQNLATLPIQYESGYVEDWTPKATVGISASLGTIASAALDIVTSGAVRSGIELVLADQLAIRAGVRFEGTLIWTMGVGVALETFSIDLAVANQSALRSQMRGTVSASWPGL